MLAPDGLALGGNWVGIPTPMLGVAPAAPCIRPLVGSAAGVLQILPQSSAFQGYTHTHARARACERIIAGGALVLNAAWHHEVLAGSRKCARTAVEGCGAGRVRMLGAAVH